MRKMTTICLVALLMAMSACDPNDPEPVTPSATDHASVPTTETRSTEAQSTEPRSTETPSTPTTDKRKTTMLDDWTYTIEEATTYQNPLEIEDQHGPDAHTQGKDYGIGDPFVMRFDGRYYLYPSSNEAAIKCFVSDNLVDWTFEGYVTDDPKIFYAYAPEVVYYHDYFYMCTSPSGHGHYILRSESPTGPFTRITENFGHGIDGSFWITDDDRLLFYYPEGMNIHVTELNPETLYPEGGGQSLNASLKWWTEGPGVFRRGDTHFLTYTGNHLISRGYRVAYSYSQEGPEGRYVMPPKNILLINAELGDPFYGLGHSSNVIGPDLDSIWTAYHNMISVHGPQRRYNLDRIMSNGTRLYSTGPTDDPHPLPERPVVEGRFEEDQLPEAFTDQHGAILSRVSMGPTFTLEYNFRLTDDAKSPIHFILAAGEDGEILLRLDPAHESMTLLHRTEEEERVMAEAEAVSPHHFRKLSQLRVEVSPERLDIYADSKRLISLDDPDIPQGPFGVEPHASLQLSYVAGNVFAHGSSDRTAIKHVPGVWEAVHSTWTVGAEEEVLPPANMLKLPAHAAVSYPLNIEADGTYALMAEITPDSRGARLDVGIDNRYQTTWEIPDPHTPKAERVQVNLGTIELEQGHHILTLQAVDDAVMLGRLELTAANRTFEGYESHFGDKTDRKSWLFYSPWTLKDDALSIGAGETTFAALKADGLTDYVVDVEVDIPEPGFGEAGIMLRASHPSVYREQVKESFIGYGLVVQHDAISLSKYYYGKVGKTRLIERGFESPDAPLRLSIRCENNVITISRDDEVLLEYVDPDAYLSGRPGVFSFGLPLTIRTFNVTAID